MRPTKLFGAIMVLLLTGAVHAQELTCTFDRALVSRYTERAPAQIIIQRMRLTIEGESLTVADATRLDGQHHATMPSRFALRRRADVRYSYASDNGELLDLWHIRPDPALASADRYTAVLTSGDAPAAHVSLGVCHGAEPPTTRLARQQPPDERRNP